VPLALASLAAVQVLAAASHAETLRVGGVLGFGLAAERVPGAFRWDASRTRADSLLAVLRLGAATAGLRGFVALATRVENDADVRSPRFALHEASLVTAWRGVRSDSLSLRLFLGQPGSLWLDHPIAPPLAPAAAALHEVAGARADGAWRALRVTVLGADRSGMEGPASGSFGVLRVRGDARPGLRLGGTWTRYVPGRLGRTGDPSHYDGAGFDVSAAARGFIASLEYSQSGREWVPRGVAATGRGGLGPPGQLTDALPREMALRAELRVPALALGRWGSIGFAPAYRALGAGHTNVLGASEPDLGSPRRGLEGHRLEAWWVPPGWPGWVRHTYDRHVEFRDADRRVIAQALEVESRLATRLRGRLFYVQRDQRGAGRRSEHHDDLVAELAAEDGKARSRLQAAVLDLDAASERIVLVLETAARLGQRVQALVRAAAASAGSRQTIFAALQYWHLPQFEAALEYGPSWAGASTDPALDADVVAAAAARDVVRLHLRGWF
jgi:hypothetical protein